MQQEQNKWSVWADRAWIYVGCVISGLMFAWLLWNFGEWSVGLKVLALIAVLVPVHVLEEWLFPGGFHYQYNVAIYGSDVPRCYPMNRLSDMYTNLGTTLMYCAFVLWCVLRGTDAPVGLVLGTVMFCGLEFIGHTYMGARMYLRFRSVDKRTIYGPGSITAYWCFVPIGILGAYWLAPQPITLTDWLVAVGLLMAIAIVWIVIPEGTLKRKDSPYTFRSFGYYERFLQGK